MPQVTVAEPSTGQQGPTSDEQIRKAEENDKWDRKSITTSYHRQRAEELPAYLERLQGNVRKTLRAEEIQITRSRDRLAKAAKTKDLFGALQESFTVWRQHAEDRFKYSTFERHEHVKKLDSSFAEQSDDHVHGGGAEDDEDPAYDFKAGFLFFERHATGWKKTTHHEDGFDGFETFPNQKITVQEALFGKVHNPISETKDPQGERHLKHIHLPANHMGWVEQAIARYHGEHDESNQNERSMTNQTLSREFWRGQEHGGGPGKYPIHSRHLRARGFDIPLRGHPHGLRAESVETSATTLDAGSEATTGASSPFQEPREYRKQFAIFLPYLHWEMHGRKARMARVVQELTSAGREASSTDNKVKHTKNDEVMTLKREMKERNAGDKNVKREPNDTTIMTWQPWEGIYLTRFKKKTKLGVYLLHVAKLWEAMDTEAEERLLKHGLASGSKPLDAGISSEPSLHIRRTLDQSYFLNMRDTSERDQDQVVYRATKLLWYSSGDLTRIIMVDQLWLWVLDDYTVLTAFPKRLGQNKPDSSGIHKSLRERLDRMDGEVTSVWHLASIIIDQCSGVFFDRTRPLDLRPEVMDMFADALNNVNEYTTIAFEAFWHQAKLEQKGKQPNSRYLSINPQGTLLREATDIDEELRMMIRIYSQQIGAVEDLREILQRRNEQAQRKDKQHPTMLVRLPADVPKSDPESDLKNIEELVQQIRARKSEIEELVNEAEKSRKDLQDLFSLKQQQAGVVAIRGIDLAELSYQQGQSIMAFTIMTIIFTPLGFFTSLFGMNNTSTGQTWMTFGEQIIIMLGTSVVIISIVLAFAFRKRLRRPIEEAKQKLAEVAPRRRRLDKNWV